MDESSDDLSVVASIDRLRARYRDAPDHIHNNPALVAAMARLRQLRAELTFTCPICGRRLNQVTGCPNCSRPPAA